MLRFCAHACVEQTATWRQHESIMGNWNWESEMWYGDKFYIKCCLRFNRHEMAAVRNFVVILT